jgi:hypothetical protein
MLSSLAENGLIFGLARSAILPLDSCVAKHLIGEGTESLQ